MSERASELVAIYGSYPMAKQFAGNDLTPDLQDDEAPAYDAAFDPDPTLKRHAACDECSMTQYSTLVFLLIDIESAGKRKLKCSGEPTGCGRCIKQHLVCHYSVQKQMGRPRKRQKTDQDQSQHARARSQSLPTQSLPEPVIDPELTAKFSERADFENVCTGPVAQTIKRASNQNYSNMPNTFPNMPSSQTSASRSSRTPPYDQPQTPPDGVPISNISYPTDATLWPDFSEMAMLPMPLQDRQTKENIILFDPRNPDNPSISYDADADPSTLLNLPSVPECPCLPNSYLTLSTLSTLSAFPVSSGTIDTLLQAHRTTKASLHCAVCPQKFQSGSQNVMLNSVLINVMADHWHRVRKATAQDLKKGFGSNPDAVTDRSPSSGASDSSDRTTMSVHEELAWRTFGHNLIRAHVFGDAPIPQPPDTPSPRPSLAASASAVTLLSALSTFERRQKQWHGQEQWTGEFPKRFSTDLQRGYTVGMTLEEIERCHQQVQLEKEGSHGGGDTDAFLCLKIVDAGRRIVMSLDTKPPTVEV
ncbi:uncharacterized protein A1O9_05964 [Exophiala aquamarina CBS 119918]|uniref:Zn(2)-C6 fungal-type domain-containing protein n=1 Tax=Exophiala aquamarina CBS 119918 TaxID=1182545 RepID=A0A072PDU5_9EURO|nr:uncharacterized protein A1O9_05964 [Exophiala aquamarina CBS 119918]KEF58041.1 hypothetical protein A1O9_05964 [Exophiala aquamarina CBS 119918]